MNSSSSRRTFKKCDPRKAQKMGGVLTQKVCYRVQGATFDPYREMDCGFWPSTRQARLGKELSERGIPFVAHQELRLFCKGETLRQTYIPDFVRYESIIVERKAQVPSHLSNGMRCKAF